MTMFESLQPPFCLGKSSVRKGIFLCFNSVFSANLVGITYFTHRLVLDKIKKKSRKIKVKF